METPNRTKSDTGGPVLTSFQMQRNVIGAREVLRQGLLHGMTGGIPPNLSTSDSEGDPADQQRLGVTGERPKPSRQHGSITSRSLP